MSKLTSVEWLAKKLLNAEPNVLEWQNYLLQAKEMHKQEIIDAFKNGLKSPYHQDYTLVTQDGQDETKSGQYYNETFKTT